jgi:hypothetical protein
MQLPLEIAMEVGSFLDRPCLIVCTTQLCWSGVGFVSRPCTDNAKFTTIQLHKLVALCRMASQAPMVEQVQANGLATEAVKRIDLCLARRTSAQNIVFFANMTAAGRANTDIYSDIHHHYSLGSNLQFNNSPSLAVEWHANAESISAVTFLLGGTNSGHLNDGRPLELCQSLHALHLCYTAVDDICVLASCQALHTLNLTNTSVLSDVSALGSCQALHTLLLKGTQVSDVSALATCQSLHTLNLEDTQVSDVSALASCQSLHTINLMDTQVSDVSALASCQALHTLDLGNTQVSDVSALASCPALHTLYLTNAGVYDISVLASCHALHTLHLGDTPVSDVSALASCQGLHTLELDNTPVSDVSALASCQALYTLRLYGTPVSDVSALVACGSLRYLHGCERMLGYGAISRLLEGRGGSVLEWVR